MTGSEVRNWLIGQLEDGPRLVVELQTAATDAGISDRALRRAKDALGIIRPFARHGPAFKGGWVWTLPPWHQPGALLDKAATPGQRRSFGALDGVPLPGTPTAAGAIRYWGEVWVRDQWTRGTKLPGELVKELDFRLRAGGYRPANGCVWSFDEITDAMHEAGLEPVVTLGTEEVIVPPSSQRGPDWSYQVLEQAGYFDADRYWNVVSRGVTAKAFILDLVTRHEQANGDAGWDEEEAFPAWRKALVEAGFVPPFGEWEDHPALALLAGDNVGGMWRWPDGCEASITDAWDCLHDVPADVRTLYTVPTDTDETDHPARACPLDHLRLRQGA